MSPLGNVVSDLDGDKLRDIITVHRDADRISTLFAREDGTSPLVGFNWSNSVNNETIEITAQARKALSLEDIVRFEHHITETWKSIVRQPYNRRGDRRRHQGRDGAEVGNNRRGQSGQPAGHIGDIANQQVRPAQQFCAHLDMCWIHTHRGELVFTGFIAQLGDLIRSGVWLQNGVIDHPGNTRILRDATQG